MTRSDQRAGVYIGDVRQRIAAILREFATALGDVRKGIMTAPPGT